MKTFIAYLLVAIFLLGSIAASAQTAPIKPASHTIKVDSISAVSSNIMGDK